MKSFILRLKFGIQSTLGLTLALSVLVSAPSARAGFLDSFRGAVSSLLEGLNSVRPKLAAAPAVESIPREVPSSNGFRISSSETSDSLVRLEGGVGNSIQYVQVEAQKLGADGWERQENGADRYLVTSARFSETLSLRRGPGEYLLKVFGCTDVKIDSCQWIANFYVTNRDTRDVAFLLPSSHIQSSDPEIIRLSRELTKGQFSDLARSKAIHDWVVSHVSYDTDSYFSGLYLEMLWDAARILRSQLAVCFGYANITAALHRAVGIPAKTVLGRAQAINTGDTVDPATDCNHAWNEILIEGEWMPQDTTWDAGYVDPVSEQFQYSPRKTYFNPSPEKFARTHLKCSDYGY